MSAKWCGDGTVCQWELTMERFMDPCRDLCGFLPSDFSMPQWWTEQVCEHPPLAAFLASVATAVDFLTKRFQQASWWKEQVWEHRPPAAFSTPVSTTVDFAKRFQQAVVVDGTGMRTPTIGDFHGLRRDRCGFFSQAISASRRGGRNRTQTSGRFLDRRLDRCGFFPSDFSKPVIDRTG